MDPHVEALVLWRLCTDPLPRSPVGTPATPDTPWIWAKMEDVPLRWGQDGASGQEMPKWSYDKEAQNIIRHRNTVSWVPGVSDFVAGPAVRYAFRATGVLWLGCIAFTGTVFVRSQCSEDGGGLPSVPMESFLLLIPVIVYVGWLQVCAMRYMLPAQVILTGGAQIGGIPLGFNFWFLSTLLFSIVGHVHMATSGLFAARLMKSGFCDGNILNALWEQTMQASFVGKAPVLGQFVASVPFAFWALVCWLMPLSQVAYALYASVPIRNQLSLGHLENEMHDMSSDQVPGLYEIQTGDKHKHMFCTRLDPDGQGMSSAVYALAECSCLELVTSKGFSALKHEIPEADGAGWKREMIRSMWRFSVFFLCDVALQPAFQSSGLAIAKAATSSKQVDIATLLSICLSLATAAKFIVVEVQKTFHARCLAQDDVSRFQEVRTSVNLPLDNNLVDGTTSEWVVDDPTPPPWIEIDLQRATPITNVRVEWWGKYGAQTKMRVLSKRAGQTSSEKFVLRGEPEKTKDFNGWSEMPGWSEVTTTVRFELDNPRPDCFGKHKSYGLRGISIEAPLHAPLTTSFFTFAFLAGCLLLGWAVVKTYMAVFVCEGHGLWNLGGGCVDVDMTRFATTK